MKEEKIICDRCNNYEVSPGGCLSKCHEAKNEPFSTMTLEYFHNRESGEKKTCKCFSPLSKEAGSSLAKDKQ